MTIISFIQLLGISFVAESIRRKGGLPFWRLLSILFLFLAFDEILRIHEVTDRLLHRLVGVKPTNFTDHLDDLIVAIYGLVFLRVLYKARAELSRYWPVWPYFAVAAFFSTLSIGGDFVGSAKPLLISWFGNGDALGWAITWFDVGEESAKILAEVFLLAAALKCYWLDMGIASQKTMLCCNENHLADDATCRAKGL